MTDDNVVQLNTNENKPHGVGQAHCVNCGKEWTAAWPIGAEMLDCPSCGTKAVVPPITEAEAIGHALRMLDSAHDELLSITTHLSTEDAKQVVRRWARGKKRAATWLRNFRSKIEETE